MLTDAQIKCEWIEITKTHRKGDVIDSVKMAIDLVRWAEKETKAALEMNLPEQCDCGKPFDRSGRCDFCGAHARYP